MRSIPNFLLLLSAVCSAATNNRPLRTTFLQKGNDWDKPCLDRCVFDLTDSPKLEKGFVQIEGKGALVDLTYAFGWNVSYCAVKEDLGPRGEEHKKKFSIDLYVSCSADKCRGVRLDKFIGRIARLSRFCKLTIGFAVVMGVENVAGAGETPHFIISLNSNLARAAQPAKFTLAGETWGNAKSARQQRRNFLDLPGAGLEKDLSLYYNEEISLITGGSACGNGTNMTTVTQLSVTPDVDIHARIGIYVSGSIGPFASVDEARVYAILNGHAGGSLDLTLNMEGEFDTGEISLGRIPISPLTVGIATVGPSIELLVRTNGTIAGSGTLGYGLKYDFNNYEISLPGDDSSVMPTAIETRPSGTAVITGDLTTHVIPRVNVGIYAMMLFDLSLFFDADASMTGRFQVAFGAGKGDVTEGSVEEVAGDGMREAESLYDDSEGTEGVQGDEEGVQDDEEAAQHSSERQQRKAHATNSLPPPSNSHPIKSHARSPFHSSFGSAQYSGHRHHKRGLFRKHRSKSPKSGGGLLASLFRSKKSVSPNALANEGNPPSKSGRGRLASLFGAKKSSQTPDSDAQTKGTLPGSGHQPSSPARTSLDPAAAKGNTHAHHGTDEAWSALGEDQAYAGEDSDATIAEDPMPSNEDYEDPSNEDYEDPTFSGEYSEPYSEPTGDAPMRTNEGSTSGDDYSTLPAEDFSEAQVTSDSLAEAEGDHGGQTKPGLLAGATTDLATVKVSSERKLNLRGEINVRVGAQAGGGLLTDGLLSLLNINLDKYKAATYSLAKLDIFEADMPFGDQSPIKPAIEAAPYPASHNTPFSPFPPNARQKATNHGRDIRPRRLGQAMKLLHSGQALSQLAVPSLPIDISLLGMRCPQHPEAAASSQSKKGANGSKGMTFSSFARLHRKKKARSLSW